VVNQWLLSLKAAKWLNKLGPNTVRDKTVIRHFAITWSTSARVHLGKTRACSYRVNPRASATRLEPALSFTRYSFTSRLLCTNQPSVHSPRPPALLTLVQYYCTAIGQNTTPYSDLPFVCHAPYNIGGGGGAGQKPAVGVERRSALARMSRP